MLGVVPGAFAKNSDKVTETDLSSDEGEVAVRSSGTVEVGSSLAWSNAGTASATDWRAKKNGLKFGLTADGSVDFTFRTLPGLMTGALVHLDAEGAYNTLSPGSSNPYMVLNKTQATSLASLYLGTAFGQGDLDWRLQATLDGGVRVLDLTDADTAYLPSGADGEAFWFRMLPLAGSSQTAVLSQGAFWSFKGHNQFLLWWDAETSYGRRWTPGFEDTMELSWLGNLLRTRFLTWNGEALVEETWDSGITLPSLKNTMALRTSFESKGLGMLRITPALYHYQADLPGFNLSRAQDVENLVASKVELRIDLDHARWGLGFQWPWAAWNGAGTSDESLKEWKITCKIDLLD